MPEITGRLQTPRLASAPSSPVAGEIYFDTFSNRLFWWDGTSWISPSPYTTAQAVSRGVLSGVPAATVPHTGWLYFATDMGPFGTQLYCDGTQWLVARGNSESVVAVDNATAAALAAYTRTGDVLDATVNGQLVVDGNSWNGSNASNAGTHILVKNQATYPSGHADHGIYTVTSSGGASAKWKLTRSAGFAAPNKPEDGTLIAVKGGTVNTASVFMLDDAGGTAWNTAATVFRRVGGGSSPYTVTNHTTDRTFDANSLTLDELADVVGTLLTDLGMR